LSILGDGLGRENPPWREELDWLLKRVILHDPTVGAIRIGRGFERTPEHKSLYHTGNRTGLPIGNYTSQFFANVYLNPVDQWIKRTLGARFYLRYLDDLVLLHRDKATLDLEAWEKRIDAFLHEELELALNPARRKLATVATGCDFLGYVVRLTHRLVRRRVVANCRREQQTSIKRAICKVMYRSEWRGRSGSRRLTDKLVSSCARGVILEEISHRDEIADVVSGELLFDIRQKLLLEAIGERRHRRFCQVLSFELSEALDFVVRFSPKRSDLGPRNSRSLFSHLCESPRTVAVAALGSHSRCRRSPTPTGVVETE